MNWESAVRSLIDDPTQRELVAACYFDAPLIQAAARYADGPEWQAIRGFIGSVGNSQGATGQRRGVAVDVGAGNGIVSFALARDGWQVIAVEPDPSDLVGAGAIRSLATAADMAIDVRSGVGEQLPLGDGEATLIVARQVLHHAADLSAFCREIGRVLAPGGLLISARDHVISGPKQLQPFLDGHPLHMLYGGENAFELDQYRAALRGGGLMIEHELNSLASVINYAPHTNVTLQTEIAQRCGPLRGLVGAALQPAPVMAAALRLLSVIDRRPGRLVSFICRKG